MSASEFASFAAYTAPPDENTNVVSSVSNSLRGDWLNAPESSYQSGAIPTFMSVKGIMRSTPSDDRAEPVVNQWETSCRYPVNFMAFGAYLLGPISALALLVFETQNDYVRFHAYQSALLTTPLVFLKILLSIASFPHWIKSLFTLMIIVFPLYVGCIAYRNASHRDLLYFYIPVIGNVAEAWLAEE